VTIDALFEGRDSAIARDLKLNLKRALTESALAGPEAPLALLALGASLDAKPLKTLATELLAGHDVSPEQTREAAESAALMGMLNMYYRFRHMVGSGQGQAHVDEHYRQAGLRMTALGKPQLGKERFEMLAFAVSVLGGCEMCINAHEQELVQLGVGRDKLHDLARLASVARGVDVLLRL